MLYEHDLCVMRYTTQQCTSEEKGQNLSLGLLYPKNTGLLSPRGDAGITSILHSLCIPVPFVSVFQVTKQWENLSERAYF